MNRKAHLAPQFRRIILIGTGGTGSYFAQGLAKLVAGYQLKVDVLLVDPDVVEEKNCARQNFHAWEIGQPKAEALAYRLNQQYGIAFAAACGKGKDHLEFGQGEYRVGSADQLASNPKTLRLDMTRLVITCVDSVSARKPCKGVGPWLDLGNGEETGQAIYGTSEDPAVIGKQVETWSKTPHVGALPSPFLVAGMARLKDAKKKRPGCADNPFAEQGIWSNEWAAAAGLTIVHQLLVKGELLTPCIYFDTAKGRMTPQFITKEYLKGA